ncbi:MAG: hypothetical protein ACREYB_03785 [Casimicrobiaceae bacterium]
MQEYVGRLRSGEWRQRSVLVFRGTGLNAWHYYSFLKNFSLAELSEFAAIYGVSGGAAIVWFYVLAQCAMFDEGSGRDFDRIIRTTMNAPGLWARLRRIVHRRLPYDEEDIGRFLSSLPAREARNLTFADSALPNFTIVAHDKRNDALLLLNARTHPHARVLDVLSQAGTPRELDREATAQPAGMPLISDFDFASAAVKRAFQQHIGTHQPHACIYQVNMLRDAVEDGVVFVKVCADRMPRWSQAMDLLLLFLALPNPHYRATFEKSYPLAGRSGHALPELRVR